MTDFAVTGGGTTFMVAPLTPLAREWTQDYVETQAWAWFGNGFAVEHRYIDRLMEGMFDAGFTVTFNGREFTEC